MTDRPDTAALAVLPFPIPGPQLRYLYRHYSLLAAGTEAEQKKLRERGINARPWDPATLGTSAQRLELWRWLEDVVLWFNHEYAWDTNQVIPGCWPEHPHLVHEITCLADERYRAALAYSGAFLADWHRQAVPLFLNRMREAIRGHCEERHQAWPARARYARQTSQESFDQRWLRANEDLVATGVLTGQPWIQLDNGDHLNVVTGEITNAAEDEEFAREGEVREWAALDRVPELPEVDDHMGPR